MRFDRTVNIATIIVLMTIFGSGAVYIGRVMEEFEQITVQLKETEEQLLLWHKGTENQLSMNSMEIARQGRTLDQILLFLKERYPDSPHLGRIPHIERPLTIHKQ